MQILQCLLDKSLISPVCQSGPCGLGGKADPRCPGGHAVKVVKVVQVVRVVHVVRVVRVVRLVRVSQVANVV